MGPAVEQIVEKTAVFMERGGRLGFTRQSGRPYRQPDYAGDAPKIANISDETLAIVHSGREQVERNWATCSTTPVTAPRSRLDQVDHAVESTVNQIKRTSSRRGEERPCHASGPRSQRPCCRSFRRRFHPGKRPPPVLRGFRHAGRRNVYLIPCCRIRLPSFWLTYATTSRI